MDNKGRTGNYRYFTLKKTQEKSDPIEKKEQNQSQIRSMLKQSLKSLKRC